MSNESETTDMDTSKQPATTPAYFHRWNAEGESCVKCGDKDWMGGGCSISDELHNSNAQEISDTLIFFCRSMQITSSLSV